MVAAVILIVMVVLLTQLLGQASNVWISSEATTERLQDLRALTDFIGSELRAALLPVNRPDTSNLQFVVNPQPNRYFTGSALSAAYSNRDVVAWQSPLATDQTLGDVAEIGYFVQWDNTTNSANPRARLCRFFINPTDTANFQIYTEPSAWISDGLLMQVAPAKPNPSNVSLNYLGLFAENVLGIWIKCLDTNGKQITTDFTGASFQPAPSPGVASGDGFDSRLGFTDSRGVKSPGYIDSTGATKPLCALPPQVQFSLALIDSHAAARIRPADQQALSKLVAASADAGTFVAAAALQYPTFRSSLRSYQTTFQLENAR